MIIRGIEAVAKGKDVFKSTQEDDAAPASSPCREEIRKDHDQAFAVQLALYQKYERGIEAVAKDNGVKTAYFLQPVPAYGKTLTEEEKRVAGDLAYRDLYRKIVAGMMTLRDQGLPIYDLGDIFEGREGHDLRRPHPFHPRRRAATARGYRLMATRMAGECWPRPGVCRRSPEVPGNN